MHHIVWDNSEGIGEGGLDTGLGGAVTNNSHKVSLLAKVVERFKIVYLMINVKAHNHD